MEQTWDKEYDWIPVPLLSDEDLEDGIELFYHMTEVIDGYCDYTEELLND